MPRTRYVRSRLAVTDRDINALLSSIDTPGARRALRLRRAAGLSGVTR